MDEDTRGFEPFNLDNDFEGGHWINGEFFYTREKRKRKPTKEEMIYGVFGESSDESENESEARRKRKHKDYQEPLEFISKGSMQSQESTESEETKTKKHKTKKTKRNVATFLFEEDNELDKEDLEKNYGVGFKLLKGMGWEKGGLGKSRKGRAEPIQPKIRPKFAGLGTIDEKTEQQKRESQRREEQSPESDEDEEKRDESSEDEMPRQKFWKKGAPKKRRVYKTAADITQEISKPAKQELVVDMRGPQVKIFSGFDKLNEQNKLMEKKKFLPELQYNISLLVDMKEGQIHSLEQKKRHEEQTINTLKKEEEELLAQLELEDKQIERVQSILEIIEKCQERMNSSSNPLDLEFLYKVIDLFQNKFSREYKLYKLEGLIFAFVFPLIKEKLTNEWNPLENPTFGSELLAKWKPLLDESERHTQDDNEKTTDSFDDSEFRTFQTPTETFDTYNRLIEEILLPRLRHVIAYEWNVRDPSSLLSLLDSLQQVVPPHTMSIILEQYVLSRLRSEVDQWNPTQDPVPIHTWIHPWSSLLASKLQPIYSSIRQKLGVTLQAWHPSDESAYLMLRPWKDVWDQQSMDQLLIRCILPKLLLVMHDFTVNPANQLMEPFKWVMRWEDVVSPHLLIQIFEQEFFPKFHTVLKMWLSGSPNYEEVMRWYLNWKKQFPERLLQNERVTAQFNYALELMNISLSGGNLTTVPPPPQYTPILKPTATATAATTTTTTTTTTTVGLSESTNKAKSSLSSVSTPTSSSSSLSSLVGSKKSQTLPTTSLSFKEALERIAQENGIVFLPTKRQHEGKQIYTFGSTSIYIDKDVIFAHSGANQWKPTSIESLLEKAKK